MLKNVVNGKFDALSLAEELATEGLQNGSTKKKSNILTLPLSSRKAVSKSSENLHKPRPYVSVLNLFDSNDILDGRTKISSNSSDRTEGNVPLILKGIIADLNELKKDVKELRESKNEADIQMSKFNNFVQNVDVRLENHLSKSVSKFQNISDKMNEIMSVMKEQREELAALDALSRAEIEESRIKVEALEAAMDGGRLQNASDECRLSATNGEGARVLQAHVRPPTYGGAPTDNPVAFLRSLGRYFLRTGAQEQDKLQVVDSCLIGWAAEWWSLHADNTSNYRQFETKFLQHYWGEHRQRKVREDLLFGRYFAHKDFCSMEDYVIKKFSRAKELIPKLTELEIVDNLLNHFDTDMRIACVNRNVKTVNDLIETIQTFELNNQNAENGHQQNGKANHVSRNQIDRHSWSSFARARPDCDRPLSLVKEQRTKSIDPLYNGSGHYGSLDYHDINLSSHLINGKSNYSASNGQNTNKYDAMVQGPPIVL